MNKIVHYIGLDVHKDSIAVCIAPQGSTEVRRYGVINGTLDAVDKLLKKLSQPGVELRVAYEACPAVSYCAATCAAKACTATSSPPLSSPRTPFDAQIQRSDAACVKSENRPVDDPSMCRHN